jgi:hypothetical protein
LSGVEKSVSEIAKEVALPFYTDAISPAAKEVGNGLTSIARMVNAGIYLTEDCVTTLTAVLRLAGEQLCLLPPERIRLDRPRVSASVMEEARCAINEPEIQEMFANLLASSMDTERAKYAHPAYVGTIRQLDSDEAKILKYMQSHDGKVPTIKLIKSHGPVFGEDGTGIETTEIYENVNLVCEDSGCLYPDNEYTYFENLERLGIISSVSGTSFVQGDWHQRIYESPKVKQLKGINPLLDKCRYEKTMYTLTGFGRGLMRACLNVSEEN